MPIIESHPKRFGKATILALDIGHTTGLYQALLLPDEPYVKHVQSAFVDYPLDDFQQNRLRKVMQRTTYIIVEYPVINKMSTLQRKTREVTNWWLTFIPDAPSNLQVVFPSQWKPLQHLAPESILPEIDRKYSKHEKDAAHMAWWWARQRILNSVK